MVLLCVPFRASGGAGKTRLLLIITSLLLLVYLGSLGIGKWQQVSLTSIQQPSSPAIKYCITSGTDTVPFTGLMPRDVGGRYVPVANNQIDINSLAWWDFVSLNWSTAGESYFGKPYDTLNPVVWETYITEEQLFPPGGSAPPSWNILTSAKNGYCSMAGILLPT
ncbi:hypothetical protein [Paraflavitalea speifideaquila]|uniref:hypothetical protein n=1 Tax=Paraflavitalea speifideaquila TaxID=3076558 RepID=UPI0028E7DE05|nr:hypothetical protein [Paraflavitalea speifideiaquila]